MLDVLQHNLAEGRKKATLLAQQIIGTERTQTLALRKFALTKVPLILACSPKVVRLDDQACIIALPLNWRTRNHFRSMYFGALAVGADCAGGLLANHHIDQSGSKVALLFKDFRADFLQRPEGTVHFTCEDGSRIAKAVEEAEQTGERINLPISIYATVPSKAAQKVATFVLTLSLKVARR